MTIFNVPMLYEADAIIGRKRKTEVVTIMASIPIEIEDHDKDDYTVYAEVARKFNNDNNIKALKYFAKKDVESQYLKAFHMVKQHNGVEILHKNHFQSYMDELRDDTLTKKRNEKYINNFLNIPSVKPSDIIYTEDDDRIKEIVSSNKNEMTQQLNMFAKEMCFIDGQLLRVSSYPSFNLEQHSTLKTYAIHWVGAQKPKNTGLLSIPMVCSGAIQEICDKLNINMNTYHVKINDPYLLDVKYGDLNLVEKLKKIVKYLVPYRTVGDSSLEELNDVLRLKKMLCIIEEDDSLENMMQASDIISDYEKKYDMVEIPSLVFQAIVNDMKLRNQCELPTSYGNLPVPENNQEASLKM